MKSNGVTFDKRLGKFKAQLFIAGKPRFFGYHDTKLEAVNVAASARYNLSAFFAKPTLDAKPIPTCEHVEKVRARLVAENASTYADASDADASGRAIRNLKDSLRRSLRVVQNLERTLTRNGGFSSP